MAADSMLECPQVALEEHGITPRSQPYASSDFKAALFAEFNATPLLFCSGGKYIDQVRNHACA